MALRLRLKPFERVVINGCVVTNGDRRNTITVSSFGQVLKSKDIMQPEQATTPVKKLYYAIQTLLIDPSNMERHMRQVNRLAAQMIAQSPDGEARRRLMAVMDGVHSGDYYKGLIELRPLVGPVKPAQDARPAGAGAGAPPTEERAAVSAR